MQFLAGVLALAFVAVQRTNGMDQSTANLMHAMSRQLMLQQLAVEERVRSEGDSGVKQIRHRYEGTRSYYSATHSSTFGVIGLHDHSNNDRTVGMGEFIAVLNGVEFRTRHNDYRLYMPHRTDGKYHKVEEIPFPDVPPEVTSKATVDEQIQEMREWFKAFKNQDSSIRDYKKYFKPIICYLEGAWTTTTEGPIDEGFHSDRHFTDAKSWFDLQERIRFTSYSGRKDNFENLSYLPTTLMNVTEDGLLQFAQWNYRILCNPISKDLPLNRFRVVDELGQRLSQTKTLSEYADTRSARFQLDPFDKGDFSKERFTRGYGLLDEIMSEIPGKDNYPGNLVDDSFELKAYSMDPETPGVLNAARYHRWFKLEHEGAFGLRNRHRGFADENLFMAMTTQPKIAGMHLEQCERNKCNYYQQKWSYAIPLEIIYLTPLNSWNPHDLQLNRYEVVTADGQRNGGTSPDTAYDGYYSRLYYRTPAAFFSGGEVSQGTADTTKNSVGVLDKGGNVHICKASGTRVFFPPILGVGGRRLRQRYPIAPVHGEGSSVWKELEALKDLVLRTKTNGFLLKEPICSGTVPTQPTGQNVTLQLRLSRTNPHTHTIEMTADQADFIKHGGTLYFESSERNCHKHKVLVKWVSRRWKRFLVVKCDDVQSRGPFCCEDRHNRWLVVMPAGV